MTFVNIDDYANSMTVAEIKELKFKETQQKKTKETNYIDFLRSYEGKYVFCQFNVNHGFVALLQKNWWVNLQPVINFNKSTFYTEDRAINPLWLKSDNPHSVNDMKEISKEEYELVIEALTAVENIRYRLQQTLFVKK